MKIPSIILAILSLALCGCTTVAPTTTTPSARLQQILAQTPGDVALVLTPILQNNPKYAPDVLLIGTTLPTLLLNGPINVGTVTAALSKIPNLTAQERTDLAYIEIGLPAAIQLGQAITGKTVALYTDPNVAAIVNAFCDGMVQAARAVLPQPNFAPATIPVQPTPAGPTPTMIN